MPRDYDEESSSSSSSSDSDSDVEQQQHHRTSSKKRSSKKKKKTIDDALDKKLKSKKKKEKKAAKAEDALEEKIRKKQALAGAGTGSAYASGGGGGGVSSSSSSKSKRNGAGGDLESGGGISMGVAAVRSAAKRKPILEEEKVEEGADPDGGGGELFTRGGGDVRSRPKPNPNNQPTNQIDPLRAAEEEKKKNAKQVNSRFADLHENGAWGGLSKWEKYGLCLLALGAIGAAIALGIKFSGNDGNDDAADIPVQTPPPSPNPTDDPTEPPTPSPTVSTYRESRGLELMTAASPKLSLPLNYEDLKGAKSNPESTPQEIAAEFMLYDDTLQLAAEDPKFMERYALSVLYYSNGGCAKEWITSTNWMSPDLDHCGNWFGVKCNLQGNVEEIILKENHVSGKIIMELSQLRELRALDLSGNVITGNVPGETLGALSKLFSLQLQNNLLEGEFPFVPLREGAASLDTLWIQENANLNGEITEGYCTLSSITLDCANFQPQPTYVSDENGETSTTTFEANCENEVGTKPREYTCNFASGTKITLAPTPTPGGGEIPVLERDTYCGIPSYAA